jgi:peroxiredoxin Q/BCP
MVTIGEKAPDFCLRDQDEKDICLKDFKNKWVVLYFYPKDNTPGCTLEAINFTHHESEFDELNAVVLGIIKYSCESHKKFQQKHDLTVALLSDPEHEVIEKYGVWKPKKLYGKEFLGTERSTFVIDPEGKIEYKWVKVKVPGHIETVLSKLKELNE